MHRTFTNSTILPTQNSEEPFLIKHWDDIAMETLEQVLDSVMKLDSEQREILVEVMQKRQIEEWRRETAASASEAIRAFHKGELKVQSAEEAISHLRADYNEDDK